MEEVVTESSARTQRRRVLVLSASDDLHALCVLRELHALGAQAHLIAMDRISVGDVVRVRVEQGSFEAYLRDVEGQEIALSDVGVVWYRRVNVRMPVPEDAPEEVVDLIKRDCRASVLGALTCFSSIQFVNPLPAADRAEYKLVQLAAAADVGLAIPKTVCSQNPSTVREFVGSLGGQAIAKPVAGSAKRAYLTCALDLSSQLSDEDIGLCPTLFQELVPGERHFRVCVFGEQVVAFSLSSQSLDWRPDGSTTFEPCVLEDRHSRALVQLHRRLGLRMGIADLKQAPDGSVVFLETNQQGQFLFCEAATGVPLGRMMAEFLLSELERA